jgi:hypothetical protein
MLHVEEGYGLPELLQIGRELRIFGKTGPQTSEHGDEEVKKTVNTSVESMCLALVVYGR